ncbi:uncharacterized protein LOC114874897 isoform X2 [Osmia bicornis bicornis]|uniref:uncharacterized protein LOC114874897 isoform X2 n=1 Tax=Osmia bicornis bicornis TaxID=1437191 RepID=UPI001EAF54E3|nr:uncharacterized protein LOC114874897 isoform X2 [Osmia bicornis bicornis]
MLRKYHVCLPFEEHQNWIKRRASLTEDTLVVVVKSVKDECLCERYNIHEKQLRDK